MRWKLVSVLATVAALAAVLVAIPAAGAAGSSDKATFIVQLLDRPAVAYEGGTAGIPATKPAKGTKIDPNAANVRRYVDYLKGTHDKVLQRVGGGDKLYDYVFSYNGFAAKLTAAQANALRKQADVLTVQRDVTYTADTSDTPRFLGLTDENGLWNQLGGPTGDKKLPGAGDGVVIGVVDSGIWPENPAFSDRDASGKRVYQQLPGWHGKCVPGEAFDASLCNQKLIGAQYFNAGMGGNAGVDESRPWEFNSPRDYNGHGSHTSSTAGGNYKVPTTGPAQLLGAVNGIAPRARIAMYKALWSTEDASEASGTGVDLVAAIDQAVADGVDVINYSISGTLTNFLDGAEVSFLFAADAGVFVSASAGNSGPAASTVAHPSPWITTVAAGTHNRDGRGSVTIGGTTYDGASLAAEEVTAPLINADDAAAGTGDDAVEAARLCFTAGDNDGVAALDPAKVAGKIVVCDRGVNARVNKSLAVAEAGGVGMIMTNVTPSSINADFHFVPSVHVQSTDRAAIRAEADTGATATIAKAELIFDAPAPFTASFSSRGPLRAGGGDLLKPDVIAPGQDILAAVAPPGNHGLEFNIYSGTSMSAPHVAGLAALLKQAHPTWSPMAIKSALMTTGTDVLDDTSTVSRIFRQGAGHVKPNSAVDPGLVFDSSFNDWLAFLCGTTTGVGASTCTALKNAGFSFDPSDFNAPSIAIGDLGGFQTITRRVTNVASVQATYTAAVTGLDGIDTDVEPSSLTLAPGQTKSFTVTFTRDTAELGAYAGGSLTWTDGKHDVRMPVVVKPLAVAAPAEVTIDPPTGTWDVTPGFTGDLGWTIRGLVAAEETPFDLAQDPDQTFDPDETEGTFSKEITVPDGTTLLRVGVLEDAITPAGTDLDVYVYQDDDLVAQSADGDSNELVTIPDPEGTYTVYVHGFDTVEPTAHVTLFEWVLGATDAGNLTIDPAAPAVLGEPQTLTAHVTGLEAGKRYLGAVDYTADGDPTGITTLVNVVTPAS